LVRRVPGQPAQRLLAGLTTRRQRRHLSRIVFGAGGGLRNRRAAWSLCSAVARKRLHFMTSSRGSAASIVPAAILHPSSFGRPQLDCAFAYARCHRLRRATVWIGHAPAGVLAIAEHEHIRAIAATALALLHVLLFAARRTRTMPERASPFSRRFEPLSSGEPVRPAMKPPMTRLYALAACRLICLRAAGDSRLTAAEIRDIVTYIINLQRTN